MKRRTARNSPALTQHSRNTAAYDPNYHWVVKDHKTQQETGFETEQEAVIAQQRLSKETNTAYRYTIARVEGGF